MDPETEYIAMRKVEPDEKCFMSKTAEGCKTKAEWKIGFSVWDEDV